MVGFYRALLWLYPRPFRELFADELCGVFARSLRDANQQGHWAVWRCFLRELLDFIPNLLREYIPDRRFYQMTERLLTHRHHSRWRQAGALGFAVGFGLLEWISRLLSLPGTKIGLPVFPGSVVQISILNQPDGQYDITAFHGLGVLLLMVCGLVAGGILNRAEKVPSQTGAIPWQTPLWTALLTALSLAAAYVLLYAFEHLLWGMQPMIPAFVFVLLNLLNAFTLLYGGLAAILLGLFLGALHRLPQKEGLGRRIFIFGVAGMAGMMAGALVGFLWLVVVGLVDWVIRVFQQLIYQLPVIPQGSLLNRSVVFGVVTMAMLSAIQGWYFGAWVGDALGKGREGQAVTPTQKPLDLSLVVIGLLSCLALIALVLFVAVTARTR
jgi:hypothetical protein